MMLRLALTFCLLVALPLSGIASDAEAWIEKMREASTQEAYRGVFVFSRGKMSSSMRVIHRYHEGQEQERLTQLDGEMGEILRRGNEVMCLIGDKKLVALDTKEFSNPVSSVFSDFDPKHMHYKLEKEGYERIVDRSAVKLAIKAKDENRYSYQLWLDEATGLLLKSQVLDQDSKPLESFQFTQLELPTTTKDEEFSFGEKTQTATFQTIPMSEKDNRWPERLAWQASFKPEGFMQVDSSDSNSNVILFSDGLANYTVFVELKDKNVLPAGASMVGATVAYMSPLMYDDKEYTVTVIGEVPPMTAMHIAKGVRPTME